MNSKYVLLATLFVAAPVFADSTSRLSTIKASAANACSSMQAGASICLAGLSNGAKVFYNQGMAMGANVQAASALFTSWITAQNTPDAKAMTITGRVLAVVGGVTIVGYLLKKLFSRKKDDSVFPKHADVQE